MKKSDKFNSSGCLDLTAYQALKNIERENAEKTEVREQAEEAKEKTQEI